MRLNHSIHLKFKSYVIKVFIVIIVIIHNNHSILLLHHLGCKKSVIRAYKFYMHFFNNNINYVISLNFKNFLILNKLIIRILLFRGQNIQSHSEN